jgi:hypothetical protein
MMWRCFSAAQAQEAAGTSPAAEAILPAKVQYNRHIRPILSNNCFKCHGPDAQQRQSGLRLDERDGATAPANSGRMAIVPGKPEQSELIRRIMAADPAERMPPPETGKTLTQQEQRLLAAWIEQGAEYERHWSLIPPVRPALPEVRYAEWPRNGIDRFILARLEAEGLTPSPEADRVTLIRRLSLDLTGLPPLPEEVDAFVSDPSPTAYEGLVERLLASPHFGERLALEWLDAARYADTHGYHIDSGRDMTRWRQWVIDAFNHDMPFDQFTIEQLAGDLLPKATLEQRIASGFHRNHMINFEGGAIPEEYHTAYVVDRVNTTSTVWLGLTLNCCQCHDHKYDPFTQQDFYRLYAFFNNVPERGLDGNKGNAEPVLKVPTPQQEAELASLASQIAELEQRFAAPDAQLDAAQAAWEAAQAAAVPAWQAAAPSSLHSAGGAELVVQPDHSILASGTNPAQDVYVCRLPVEQAGTTAFRLEALPHESLPAQGPGRSSNGNVVLTGITAALAEADDGERPLQIKRATADFSQQGFPIEAALDADSSSGWALYPEVGKAHAAVFELAAALEAGQELIVTLRFESPFAQHQLGRFRFSFTTAADPHATDALPPEVHAVLSLPASERSEEQARLLRTYYRQRVDEAGRALAAQLEGARGRRAELEQQIPTTMVMAEMPQPRPTFLLIRGQYDKRGEQVSPGVPAALPPLAEGLPPNRLGLAQWLVSPRQPLTARVIVNRYWQMLFGTGLVKTSEDFGVQGEWPSHPELLDWLAVEFREGCPSSPECAGPAWSVKSLLRLLVTSATYRQASVVRPELQARDPENRLLARMPRLRLPAELIRDQALAAAGLLQRQIGGHSVSPYQPPGLWEELAYREDGANWTAQTYVQSHGADLYRRTMYTFWKRTSPPPSLATFDAPDRETCTVRRARTNTPLQALVLLNDPTYVEAARKLAERVLQQAEATAEARAALAFKLCTARCPKPAELEILLGVLREQQRAYHEQPQVALELLAVGESSRDESLDPAELAAWTVVCSTILNLDEVITRP